jgi:hypothetical protein
VIRQFGASAIQQARPGVGSRKRHFGRGVQNVEIWVGWRTYPPPVDKSTLVYPHKWAKEVGPVDVTSRADYV